MNDDGTLRDNKVTNGSKIMVVGSTINDVLAVAEPALKTQKQNDKFDVVSSKEPFSKQKVSCTVCSMSEIRPFPGFMFPQVVQRH